MLNKFENEGSNVTIFHSNIDARAKESKDISASSSNLGQNSSNPFVFEQYLIGIAVTAAISLAFATVEYLLPTYNSNGEFQSNFDSLFDRLLELAARDDAKGVVSEVGRGSPNFERFNKIKDTLVNTYYGHAQPETLPNIEKVLTFFAALGMKNIDSQLIMVTTEMILKELISDSGEIKEIIPMLSKYALDDKLSTRTRLRLANILVLLARDPQNWTTLAENNAVSVFGSIVNDTSIGTDKRLYYFAINDIVQHVNSSSSSMGMSEMEEKERNLINRCAKSFSWAHSYWVNEITIWGMTLMAAMTNRSVGLATSLLGFGAIYSGVKLLDQYETRLNFPIKSNSKTQRFAMCALGAFVPLTAVGVMAQALSPASSLMGYLAGTLITSVQHNYLKPYFFLDRTGHKNDNSLAHILDSNHKETEIE